MNDSHRYLQKYIRTFRNTLRKCKNIVEVHTNHVETLGKYSNTYQSIHVHVVLYGGMDDLGSIHSNSLEPGAMSYT